MRISIVLVLALVAPSLQQEVEDMPLALRSMLRGGGGPGDDEMGEMLGETVVITSREEFHRHLAFGNATASNGTASSDQGIVGGRPVSSAREWFAEGRGCGATLIWKDFLVTAAHCYVAFEVGDTVYIGHTKSRTLTSGAEVKTIKALYIPSYYSPSSYKYDVMLVQLTSRVRSTRAFAIMNGNSQSPATGASVMATGTGRLYFNGPSSSTVNTVTVKAVSNSDCTKAFGSSVSTSSMLCAGANGKDTCQGDSGGPLTLGTSNTLVGITSFGKNGCALPGYPAVYTRVSYYSSWIIASVVCKYSSSKPTNC